MSFRHARIIYVKIPMAEFWDESPNIPHSLPLLGGGVGPNIHRRIEVAGSAARADESHASASWSTRRPASDISTDPFQR